MLEDVIDKERRKVEIPRRGSKLCALLDRSPILEARQNSDHRTYRNTVNGEIVTVLNKKRDLRDINPKVYFKVAKTLRRWGIFG